MRICTFAAFTVAMCLISLSSSAKIVELLPIKQEKSLAVYEHVSAVNRILRQNSLPAAEGRPGGYAKLVVQKHFAGYELYENGRDNKPFARIPVTGLSHIYHQEIYQKLISEYHHEHLVHHLEMQPRVLKILTDFYGVPEHFTPMMVYALIFSDMWKFGKKFDQADSTDFHHADEAAKALVEDESLGNGNSADEWKKIIPPQMFEEIVDLVRYHMHFHSAASFLQKYVSLPNEHARAQELTGSVPHINKYVLKYKPLGKIDEMLVKAMLFEMADSLGRHTESDMHMIDENESDLKTFLQFMDIYQESFHRLPNKTQIAPESRPLLSLPVTKLPEVAGQNGHQIGKIMAMKFLNAGFPQLVLGGAMATAKATLFGGLLRDMISNSVSADADIRVDSHAQAELLLNLVDFVGWFNPSLEAKKEAKANGSFIKKPEETEWAISRLKIGTLAYDIGTMKEGLSSDQNLIEGWKYNLSPNAILLNWKNGGWPVCYAAKFNTNKDGSFSIYGRMTEMGADEKYFKLGGDNSFSDARARQFRTSANGFNRDYVAAKALKMAISGFKPLVNLSQIALANDGSGNPILYDMIREKPFETLSAAIEHGLFVDEKQVANNWSAKMAILKHSYDLLSTMLVKENPKNNEFTSDARLLEKNHLVVNALTDKKSWLFLALKHLSTDSNQPLSFFTGQNQPTPDRNCEILDNFYSILEKSSEKSVTREVIYKLVLDFIKSQMKERMQAKGENPELAGKLSDQQKKEMRDARKTQKAEQFKIKAAAKKNDAM